MYWQAVWAVWALTFAGTGSYEQYDIDEDFDNSYDGEEITTIATTKYYTRRRRRDDISRNGTTINEYDMTEAVTDSPKPPSALLSTFPVFFNFLSPFNTQPERTSVQVIVPQRTSTNMIAASRSSPLYDAYWTPNTSLSSNIFNDAFATLKSPTTTLDIEVTTSTYLTTDEDTVRSISKLSTKDDQSKMVSNFWTSNYLDGQIDTKSGHGQIHTITKVTEKRITTVDNELEVSPEETTEVYKESDPGRQGLAIIDYQDKIARGGANLPQINFPIMLQLLSNLTDEFNLTQQFNESLQKFEVPTCPPTRATTETENPFENASVISKCFVCGLKTPQIPYDSRCADAFAGDFIPLVPVDTKARSSISRYRKYCRYLDVPGFVESPFEPRSVFGRFTGGCSVRWVDLTGIYTQRACRNARRPVTGKHFASKRMAKLELALTGIDNGCLISPMATLIPVSRAISLYARFHACVCTGEWCNRAVQKEHWMTNHKIVSMFTVLLILS